MQIYNFHFKINSDLKILIKDVSNELNLKFGAAVGFIIKKMLFTIDYYINNQPEVKKTDYEIINGNACIHVKLTENEYRKLKNYHSGMNTFSMAIVVRKLLMLFLKGVNEFGVREFLKMIEEKAKEFYNNLKKVKHINKKTKFKDMYKNYKANPTICYKFDNNFTILQIDFL